ncbi:MAG: TRAP transporter substrate-binding protein [Kiritimatiellaeota bacterium]|nr:TRAP transporter substrate-binding protein [Kiritimatiellota bacterium]
MKLRCRSVFFASAVVLLAGCGRQEEQDPARKTYTFRYSVFFPPTHVQAKLAQAWADELRERSGGQLQVTVFPGGTLTKADQCYQGVLSGASDIGMSMFAYTRGRFPLLELLDLPVGYPDGVAATHIANEVYFHRRPAEAADTQIMYLHAHGPGILASRKPVKALADLQGLKVRATGFSAKLVESLGASPISMPQGETYEALQKGVVDATFCPVEALKGWKQGEVIKYVTDSECVGYTTVCFVAMNKAKWESLPEGLQQLIAQVNREWIAKHGQAWNDADAEGLAFVHELKHEIIPLSAEEQAVWREKVDPLLADSAAKVDAKGLPGSDVLKDIQFLVKVARAGELK